MIKATIEKEDFKNNKNNDLLNDIYVDESLLDIKDIAHALSLICRGNGHVQAPSLHQLRHGEETIFGGRGRDRKRYYRRAFGLCVCTGLHGERRLFV